MFLTKLKEFNKFDIILASNSPRRKELLESLKINFRIIPSDFDESSLDPVKFSTVNEYVLENSKQKGLTVMNKLNSENQKPDLIISCDTVISAKIEQEIPEDLKNNPVFLQIGDRFVMGKPKTKENSFKMLSFLSGKQHNVISGVTLLFPKFSSDENCITFSNSTSVFFKNLSTESINAYIDTSEPIDKAGGYAIQGLGVCLIEKIDGSWSNVVGFPLSEFCEKVSEKFEEIEKKK
ncbi:bifunctional dttp/utp pyrophosphatase/methyltransferase protein-related [Anaeramoeba ignava]|uniref:Bifunctional dttp/utp pyrophosphatase/methyltransferase protein-related n=1 Tax=Anaeramoeba ignava TaxID=1746090 RepID=A0A9Q0LIU1_ANAIG|nr:bifunctional dttp/utp pyrophosphatase/methyltransferase protein-related [Anaeramoeba ignava]